MIRIIYYTKNVVYNKLFNKLSQCIFDLYIIGVHTFTIDKILFFNIFFRNLNSNHFYILKKNTLINYYKYIYKQ